MDTEKTRAYYASLTSGDVCGCAYCQNYVRHIRAAYPLLSGYLDNMGVNMEMPFETMPIEPEPDGTILYIGSQYIVMGSASDFEETTLFDKTDVSVGIAESHPVTNVDGEHFVIELSELRLPWAPPRN